jgi:hypothetical protein
MQLLSAGQCSLRQAGAAPRAHVSDQPTHSPTAGHEDQPAFSAEEIDPYAVATRELGMTYDRAVQMCAALPKTLPDPPIPSYTETRGCDHSS